LRDGVIGVRDALIVRNAFTATSAIVRATASTAEAADRAGLALSARRARVLPAIVDSVLDDLRIGTRRAIRR
jgi:hypothetical protein